MSNDMGLGERIKEAREAAGLTQDDLAYRLRAYRTLERTTGSQLSKWEKNDVGRLSFNAIDAIARETSKPLEFFSGSIGARLVGPPGVFAAPRHDAQQGGLGGNAQPRPGQRRRRRRSAEEPT